MTTEIRNKIEQYGMQIDHLAIGCEYDKLKLLLDEIVDFTSTDDEIKKDAAINYYLGTGFGTYSDHLARSGKGPTESQEPA